MARHMRWNTGGGAAASIALVLLGGLGSGCEENATDSGVAAPVPASPQGTDSDSGTTAASGTDTPATPGADGDCPPPREVPGFTCAAQTLYARNPDSGACCTYASHCEVPESWARFAEESECRDSCRCERVTPSDFSGAETSNTVSPGTEYLSLECFCGLDGCPTSFTQALQDLCPRTAAMGPLSIVRGCGRIAIQRFGGFVGAEQVFDAATGALIGARRFSDVPSLPCNTYESAAGEAFECEDATECDPCARGEDDPPGDLPPCE